MVVGTSFPKLIRRTANFVKAVVKHVADGGKHVSDEVYLARLWVCADCPSLDPERMRCLEKSCGCRLKVKARWRSESCPQEKWPRAEDSSAARASARSEP